MNRGNQLILVLLMAGLLVSCSSRLRESQETGYFTFTPPAERMHEYTRFAFHDSDARGSVLVEGWVQNHLTRLMENKGYVYDPIDPEFTLGVEWDVSQTHFFLRGKGYMKPAATTTAWGTYKLGMPPEEAFLHQLTLNLRDTGTLQTLWEFSDDVQSTSRDIRTTSVDLLKRIVEFLPSHGTTVHEAEYLPDQQFDRYAFRNLMERDFTLPGLDSYVTITSATDRKLFNPDDVRAMMDDPILLAMFVDLLQHAVHYRVDESGLLEITGEYQADGMRHQLYVRAQSDGVKYRVTEMRDLNAPEFAALQDEIFSASLLREADVQVFREVQTPKWQIVLTDSMREQFYASTPWHEGAQSFLSDSALFAGVDRTTPWRPPFMLPGEEPIEMIDPIGPPTPFSETVWWPPADGFVSDSARMASSERKTRWLPPPVPGQEMPGSTAPQPFWASATDEVVVEKPMAPEPMWSEPKVPHEEGPWKPYPHWFVQEMSGDSLLPVAMYRAMWMADRIPDSLRTVDEPDEPVVYMWQPPVPPQPVYPLWYQAVKSEPVDSLDFRNPDTPWWPPKKNWINK